MFHRALTPPSGTSCSLSSSSSFSSATLFLKPPTDVSYMYTSKYIPPPSFARGCPGLLACIGCSRANDEPTGRRCYCTWRGHYCHVSVCAGEETGRHHSILHTKYVRTLRTRIPATLPRSPPNGWRSWRKTIATHGTTGPSARFW